MKEVYLKMKQSDSWDLNWFWNYYVKEFEKIDKNFINSEGKPDEHKLIPFDIFQQLFQQSFMFRKYEMLGFTEIRLGFDRLEDKNGNLIKLL